MAFEELTRLLDSMPSCDIPAADCLVYYRGKPVYRHMVGWSDVEEKIPVTEDTLFNLYSASKVATCTAALTLYDAGIYGLDDPVGEYLPSFKDVTVRLPGSDAVRKAAVPMTIRHLFTMSGGLDYDLQSPSIQRVMNEKGEAATTRELVDAIAEKPLDFEPGTRYRYSLCHDVLGGLIEVWSGESFGSYLKKAVLDPVGMKDTGFARTEEVFKRLAYQYHGYDHKTGRFAKKDKDCVYRLSASYQSGGAGLVSSVADYAKFANVMAHFGVTPDGERILKKETIEEMRRDQLDPVRRADFAASIGVGQAGYSYGLGVRTLICPERSPSGFAEFGWDGAAGAFMLIDPENETAVFYAQHEFGAPWHHLEIRDAVYRGLKS
ncbi:MAG: beta-lactamase family protein [Clostridia bacterium]|nr:beta-lactamase family protein [Clostridia bacterium]